MRIYISLTSANSGELSREKLLSVLCLKNKFCRELACRGIFILFWDSDGRLVIPDCSFVVTLFSSGCRFDGCDSLRCMLIVGSTMLRVI